MKRVAIVMFVALMGSIPLAAQSAATETVRLGYELTLTRCKAAGDCQTSSAAKGEADVVLQPGANGLTGAQTLQLQADGVKYAAAIKASSVPEGRHVDVAMTGERTTAPGASMTFHAHSAASCVAWNTLPDMTLTADAYTANGETVTPVLHVKVITP
jgi:hypothetical protein